MTGKKRETLYSWPTRRAGHARRRGRKGSDPLFHLTSGKEKRENNISKKKRAKGTGDFPRWRKEKRAVVFGERRAATKGFVCLGRTRQRFVDIRIRAEALVCPLSRWLNVGKVTQTIKPPETLQITKTTYGR